MIKFLSKLTAILITLLISASVVLASGKMEVKIGDTVDLKGESAESSSTYKWTVSKDKSILKTITGQNFSYKFDNQGEHIVNLTATSGSKVETTSVSVLVGEKYTTKIAAKKAEGAIYDDDRSGTFYLVLETLPQKNTSGQVEILGDSGKVYFLMEQSVGDILEYRIDKNIYKDSDGDGVANNDIDNSNDNSYLTGKAWSATYKKGETSKVAAQITLVDKNGKKVKEQVEIVFKDATTTGDPVAVLDVTPATDATDGLVHLYNDPHKVGFYSRRSTGKILEYRIDKNIFEDSDNDGDPKNDIDNLNDISFKTGDVWETSYDKTEDQIIAQLIVVGEGGKGSRVQKGLKFGSKPTPPAPPLAVVKQGITLTSDKDIVLKGDPITFTVKGLSLALSNYSFDWDFDGDGTVDKEVDGSNTIKHSYSKPGVVTVKVTITDKSNNTADKTLSITVKDTDTTEADFTYKVEGNKVTFTNASTADHSLSNKQLDYKWSFGDTDSTSYTKQQAQTTAKDPVYSYNSAGNYTVILTITDADKVTDTKTETIEIKTGAATTVSGKSTTETKKEGSVFVKILKILLYLILIVIALILLIVGGFLIFLKVQHPDLTFEELVDELKVKILTMIGAAEHVPPPSGPTPPPPAAGAAEEGAPETAEPVAEEGEVTEEPAEPTAPPVAEKGPTPSWLQDKDVIEGEAEESIEEPSVEGGGEEELYPEDDTEDYSEGGEEDLLSEEEGEEPYPDEEVPEGAPDWLIEEGGEGEEPYSDEGGEEFPEEEEPYPEEGGEEYPEEEPIEEEVPPPAEEPADTAETQGDAVGAAHVQPDEKNEEGAQVPSVGEEEVPPPAEEAPEPEPVEEPIEEPIEPQTEPQQEEVPKKKKKRRRRRKKKKPATEGGEQPPTPPAEQPVQPEMPTPPPPVPPAPTEPETPPAPPAEGGEQPPASESPAPESPSGDEKGPVPDWLKGQ